MAHRIVDGGMVCLYGALCGTALGLLLSTMVMGISVAGFGPLPGREEQTSFLIKSVLVALLAVFVFGWLIARPLRNSMWSFRKKQIVVENARA